MSEYLRLEGVCKYIDDCKILDNISFFTNSGDIFGFLGPNGSGKTTTIRIILGLLSADKGNIYFFGKRISDKSNMENLKIGFCLDRNGLYEELSARDNLLFYGRLYGVEEDQLKKRIEYFSELFKMNKRLNDPIKAYSKGMKQKIAIIKSILHKPKLLILDEPTSGLDPDMQMQLRNIISMLSKECNVSTIFSSHQLDEVEKICNKVAIICKGKIVAFDSINKLKANDNTGRLHAEFDYKVKKANNENWVRNIENIHGVIEVKRALGKLIVDVISDDIIPNVYAQLLKDNIHVEKVALNSDKSLEDIYVNAVGENQNENI